MLSIFKAARSYASNSRTVDTPLGSFVPRDGFGVMIKLLPEEDEQHFTLFANINEDEPYQNDDYPDAFDETDKVLESFSFPTDIVHFDYLLFDGVPQWKKAVGSQPAEPTALEAVVIFIPPIAEGFAGNNNLASPIELLEIGMRFENPYAVEDSEKRCQYITLNRIKGFPEISYTNCSEYEM
jgi:hypothetical protein